MIDVPMVVRGQLVEDDWVSFGGRAAGIEFRAPDPAIHIERLPLPSPMDMADLYSLTFDDIVDYLDRLGKALDPDANKHVQVAHDAALALSLIHI